MKILKTTLLFAALLVFLFAFTACQRGGQGGTVTLTIGASQDWIEDIDRTLAREFEAATGIKIEFQVFPDDQYTSIVRARLLTGEGPDIFYANSGVRIVEYMPERYFADLTGEPWLTRLEEWAIGASTYRGRVVGLSMWSIDGWGIVYNSDIFRRLGLSVPRNFNEFVAVCERLLAAGITPIYEPGADTWHGCLWLLEIADFVNRRHPGLYERFNTPAGKFVDVPEALTLTEQYLQLVNRGFFGPNWLSQGFGGAAEGLATERFGMFLTYTAWANENASDFPNANMRDWGMFPVPLADNNTFSHSGGGILMAINRDSRNIDAAKQWFSFLTQLENAQRYYDGKLRLANSAVKGVVVAPLKAMDDIIANSPGGMGPDFAASIPFYNADDVGRPYRDLAIGLRTPLETLQAIDATRASMFEVMGN